MGGVWCRGAAQPPPVRPGGGGVKVPGLKRSVLSCAGQWRG